jgi:hypothetical protein
MEASSQNERKRLVNPWLILFFSRRKWDQRLTFPFMSGRKSQSLMAVERLMTSNLSGSYLHDRWNNKSHTDILDWTAVL